MGNSTRMCQLDGMWSGSEPTCISEPNLTVCICSLQSLYACICKSKCVDRWSSATILNPQMYNLYNYTFFHSTVVDCGTLNTPMNGEVSHFNGTTFRQTATYSCNTGYNLVGDNARMCEVDGMWSGSEPTCISEPNLTVHM